MIDLHVHTTASDGRADPAEVIRRAAARRVDRLVFTDHSVVTFDGLSDTAARAGVDLPFPGVEVSTFHKGRTHHLVIYGGGVLTAWFRSYIRHPNQWKTSVLEAVHRSLVREGVAMPSLDDIRTGTAPGLEPTPGKAYPSRTAVARCLAALTGAPLGSAYDRVVRLHRAVDQQDAGRPDRLARRYLPTLDVLAAAKRAGATPALAHPLWQCRTAADVPGVLDDLPLLVEHGLWGIATRSYHHRELDDHPLLRSAAHRLGLTPIGGSDYHGNGRTELGVDATDEESYAALVAAIAAGSTQGADGD